MKIDEVKTTATISESQYLEDFLADGWIIIGTESKNKKTYYTLGHSVKGQKHPGSYQKFAKVMAEAYSGGKSKGKK